MSNTIKEIETLLVETNIPCKSSDLEKFRKQVIAQAIDVLGSKKDHSVFHNHSSEGLVFRYPYVQYRSKNRKLVLFAWGEAVPLLVEVISKADPFGDALINVNTTLNMKKEKTVMVPSNNHQYYRLMDWVAFNNESYNTWKETYTMKERIVLLDQAITGHLRVLAETFLSIEEVKNITAELVSIKKMKQQRVYGNDVLGFNVIFRTMWEMPKHFALGRNISIGCGTLQKLKNHPEDKPVHSKSGKKERLQKTIVS